MTDEGEFGVIGGGALDFRDRSTFWLPGHYYPNFLRVG